MRYLRLLVIALSIVTSFSAVADEPSVCEKLLGFYNPFNFEARTVQAVQLLGQKFYEPSDRGVVVGINGLTGIYNGANAEFLTGKPFADDQRVFHYSVEMPEQVLSVLLRTYRKSGPIHRLAILAHGSPGDMHIGLEYLLTLWGYMGGEELRGIPNDLFAKDAEIILLSSRNAQGYLLSPDWGVNKLRKVFSKIVRNGATIVASRQMVDGSTEGFDETPLVTQIREMDKAENDSISTKITFAAVASYAIPKLFIRNIFHMAILDEKSKFEPIAVIDLPPSPLPPRIKPKIRGY